MKRILPFLAILALLLLLGSAATGAAAPPAVPPGPPPEVAPPEIVPGQLIVKLRPELAGPDRLALLEGLAMRELAHSGPLGASLVALPRLLSVERAIALFADLALVEYAEPNYLLRAALVPDDPLYGPFQRWYYDLLGAPQAWDVTTGSEGIVVATIDSGVDIEHPELRGRIWTNRREVAGNGLDDDGNGCVDDVHGCDFTGLAPDGAVGDDNGHGTLVAGVIAAAGNNGRGVAGAAWRATVMPVKALDRQGVGTTWGVAQSIFYAAQNGARILNLSFSSPLASAVMAEALRIAHDRYGAIVVAAVGNEGKGQVTYPAGYERAIAVGASARLPLDVRAPFSNWGPYVDFVAPGVDICSTFPGSSYSCGQGTSLAAALVAGTAALLLAKNPSLTGTEVRAILRLTAQSLPDGDASGWAGAGRIHMGRALTTTLQRSVLPGVGKD